MRKFFACLALALSLGACSTISTLTGASISPTAVIVAANAFDAAEATATVYITSCIPAAVPVWCKPAAVKTMVPAIRAGRTARSNLEAFMAANSGKLGDVGLYNTLVAATTTLQQIEAQYSIGSK